MYRKERVRYIKRETRRKRRILWESADSEWEKGYLEDSSWCSAKAIYWWQRQIEPGTFQEEGPRKEGKLYVCRLVRRVAKGREGRDEKPHARKMHYGNEFRHDVPSYGRAVTRPASTLCALLIISWQLTNGRALQYQTKWQMRGKTRERKRTQRRKKKKCIFYDATFTAKRLLARLQIFIIIA